MLDQAQFERGSRTCVTVEVVHDLQYAGIAEPFERFRAVYTVRFKPHARICEGESRMAELLDRD